MDKREMLDRLAANGDERLLLGRVWDKYEQCRRRNLPQGTGFLSPAEQAAAQRLLNALSVSEGYTFWGGYDGAQRRQLWFLPDWQEAPEEDAVRVVRASFYEEDSLTHRDILGSLMALGVTRETLGDILVSPAGPTYWPRDRRRSCCCRSGRLRAGCGCTLRPCLWRI